MAPRTGIFLAFLLAGPALGAAPEKADKADKPDQAKGPVFSSEVSLVSVPVFITDKGGKGMPGLTAADFELFEDGQRVPIVSFQYVDTTDGDQQELIRQAPAARRRFLFLFDLS